MNGETILAEAQRLTALDRQSKYGIPLDNWSDIATKWSVTLRRKLKSPITAEEAALCMIDLKTCREANVHQRDNLTDAAGYANVVDMIHEERERRAAQPVEPPCYIDSISNV